MVNKKQAKTSEGAACRTQPNIPPSWSLSDVQRAFIEELWQDAAPAQMPPQRPVALIDDAAAAGQRAEQHLQDGQTQQDAQWQTPTFRQIVQQTE